MDGSTPLSIYICCNWPPYMVKTGCTKISNYAVKNNSRQISLWWLFKNHLNYNFITTTLSLRCNNIILHRPGHLWQAIIPNLRTKGSICIFLMRKNIFWIIYSLHGKMLSRDDNFIFVLCRENTLPWFAQNKP